MVKKKPRRGWHELPFSQVVQLITTLRRATAENCSIDTIRDRLVPLCQGFPTVGRWLDGRTKIFRGVRWNERPLNVGQLSYPPSAIVKTLGRLNRVGESRFYASTCRESALYELHGVPGDQMAISRWGLVHPVLVNTIGYHSKVRRNFRSSAVPQPWELSPDNYRRPAHRLIAEFFAEEFSRAVPTGSEDLYTMTVAITERFLGFSSSHRPVINPAAWMTTDGPIQFGGILYPTLAMRANGDNIMLLPEIVDTCLALRSVDYVEILNVDDLQFTIRTIDHATHFGSNGEIGWTGRPPIPLPQNGLMLLVVDPMSGRLTRVDSDEAVETVSAEPSYSFYNMFR